MTLDTPLDFALAYAQAGFKVLPLHSVKNGKCTCGKNPCLNNPGKHPRTEHGSVDATTDAATIRGWWTKWPAANIGMTLDNLVVVDVDPRNGGDLSLETLIKEHGPLPETCNAKTGGGGSHHVYAARNGTEYSSNLGSGIDVKTGAGSYIVVEPSIHASGEKYNWLDESEPWTARPAEAPEWLATKPKVKNKEGAGGHHQAVDWLDSIVRGEALHDSLRGLAAHFAVRGIGFAEICKVLELAMNGSKAPRDERWHARIADIPNLVNSAIEKFRVPSDGAMHFLDRGFWAHDAKVTTALPYVVKGLFGKGQIIAFWGAPGSGKSFNETEMACCIGANVRWRGRRVRGGVVICVVAESARPYIENRIAALIRERPELARAAVFIIPLALDLLHTEHGDVDRVIATAKNLAEQIGEVVLIAIDTLAATFGGGDENMPADMGRYVANVLRIRDMTGAAVLIVHHCGKNEAAGMRGHSALLGAIDAELAIEGEPGGQRILRTGKVRDGAAFTDLFAFTLRVVDLGVDQDNDSVTTCVIDSTDESGTRRARQQRKGAGLGKHQKAVLRALETAGGRLGRVELARKLKDEGMPRNRVYDAIGGLLENGMLIAHNDCVPAEVALQ